MGKYIEINGRRYEESYNDNHEADLFFDLWMVGFTNGDRVIGFKNVLSAFPHLPADLEAWAHSWNIPPANIDWI